jgi:methionyl-tRNA formyltransferase
MRAESVLFVGDSSRWSVLASTYLRSIFCEVDSIFWDHGAPEPDIVHHWSGDYVFCFKADLVLTAELLSRVRKSAINFHPCPPRYRGVGGYYYALAYGDSEFGVTCHHIITKIDAGSIIKVQRFPIAPGETGESLTDRAAAYLLLLFYEVVHLIQSEATLPRADETWGTKLYTRRMLKEFLLSGSLDTLETPRTRLGKLG